uniref:Calmodulin n=1 Tax=Eutreptiella gymnastica TaxID=73025 RepID=A0A7S4LCH3_9EUGL|mmetsp:Transcript_62399/g.103611  ORF Transcript_62399/g.103611 Transcript_62399/m.103611 type:complete len:411 (-) Transcript_62399:132-1364(-)
MRKKARMMMVNWCAWRMTCSLAPRPSPRWISALCLSNRPIGYTCNKYSTVRCKELKQIFDLFDERGQGELRHAQIKDILEEARFLGDDPSQTHDDYAEQILQRSDVDESGGLNFEEFISDAWISTLTMSHFGPKKPPRSLQEARGLNPSKSLGGGGDYCALNPDAHVWDGGLRVIKEWNHRNSTIAAEEAEAQRRLQEAKEADIQRQRRRHGSFYGVEDKCFICIFGFLEQMALIRSVCRVATKYNWLTRTPSLWTRLLLANTHPSTHPHLYTRLSLLRLLNFPAEAPEAVLLDDSHYGDEDVHAVVRSLSTRLRVLGLSGAVRVTDKTHQYISLYCDRIEELDLRRTSISIDQEEMGEMCEPEADKPESGSSCREVDVLTMFRTNHPQLKSYETVLGRNEFDSPEAMQF